MKGLRYDLKKHGLKSLWTALLSVLLAIMTVAFFNIAVLEAISGNTDRPAMIDLMYAIRNTITESGPVERKVVIADFSGHRSREEIADAIRRIDSCGPRRIGIDIIFGEAASADYQGDSLLASTIAASNRMVTVCRVVEKGRRAGTLALEHSFYTAAAGVPFGAVADYRLHDFDPFYKVGRDTVLSFPLLLAEAEFPHTRAAVNYSNRNFQIVDVFQEFSPHYFRDKIVLIGDVNDWRDHRELPFRIGGKIRLSGVEWTAYAVQTALSGEWVRRIPDVWNWLAALAGCWLFAFYIRCESGRSYPGLRVSALTAGMIVTLSFFTFVIFSETGWLFDLSRVLIAIAMTAIATDLLRITRKCKLKKRKKV